MKITSDESGADLQILRGQVNYFRWKRDFKVAAQNENLWSLYTGAEELLDKPDKVDFDHTTIGIGSESSSSTKGKIPSASVIKLTSEGIVQFKFALKEYEKQDARIREARTLLCAYIDPSIRALCDQPTPQDAFNAVISQHKIEDSMARSMLAQHMETLQLARCSCMQDYINQHTQIKLDMEECGGSYDNWQMEAKLLRGLTNAYRPFVTQYHFNLAFSPTAPLVDAMSGLIAPNSLSILTSRLLTYETLLKTQNQSGQVSTVNSNNGSQKKDKKKKRKEKDDKARCPTCKKMGHGAEECWFSHPELNPHKNKDGDDSNKQSTVGAVFEDNEVDNSSGADSAPLKKKKEKKEKTDKKTKRDLTVFSMLKVNNHDHFRRALADARSKAKSFSSHGPDTYGLSGISPPSYPHTLLADLSPQVQHTDGTYQEIIQLQGGGTWIGGRQHSQQVSVPLRNTDSTSAKIDHFRSIFDFQTPKHPSRPYSLSSTPAVPTHNSYALLNSEQSLECCPSTQVVGDLNTGRGEWILDTGANAHISNDTSWFSELTLFDYEVNTAANDGTLQIKGGGTIRLFLARPGGGRTELIVKDVAYAPTVRCNILAPTLLAEISGIHGKWNANGMTLLTKDGLAMAKTTVRNRLCYLQLATSKSRNATGLAALVGVQETETDQFSSIDSSDEESLVVTQEGLLTDMGNLTLNTSSENRHDSLHDFLDSQIMLLTDDALKPADRAPAGVKPPLIVAQINTRHPMYLAHQKLGHLGFSNIEKLSKISTGLGLRPNDLKWRCVCPVCSMTRAIAQPSKEPATRRHQNPGDLVFIDIWGPYPITGWNQEKYACTLTDDATRYTWMEMLHSRGSIVNPIKAMVRQMETGHNITVRRVRWDREFESNKVLTEWLEKKGITVEATAASGHHQVGIAERLNRTMRSKAAAMLFDEDLPKRLNRILRSQATSLIKSSSLPRKLWPEAVRHAIYLKNRSPTRALKNQTPYEALYTHVTGSQVLPDLGDEHVWGCRMYVTIKDHAYNQPAAPDMDTQDPVEDILRKPKLDPNARLAYFVGKDSEKVFRFWDPERQNVFTTTFATFDDDDGFSDALTEYDDEDEYAEYDVHNGQLRRKLGSAFIGKCLACREKGRSCDNKFPSCSRCLRDKVKCQYKKIPPKAHGANDDRRRKFMSELDRSGKYSFEPKLKVIGPRDRTREQRTQEDPISDLNSTTSSSSVSEVDSNIVSSIGDQPAEDMAGDTGSEESLLSSELGRSIIDQVQQDLGTEIHELDRLLAVNAEIVRRVIDINTREVAEDQDATTLNDLLDLQESVISWVSGAYDIQLFGASVLSDKDQSKEAMSKAIQDNALPPLPPSKEAVIAYKERFPFGYNVMSTPSDGLRCGIYALQKSMIKQLRPILPSLKVEVRRIEGLLKEPEYRQAIQDKGLHANKLLTADQLGLLTVMWGKKHKWNFRLGVVRAKHAPILLPHHDTSEPCYILWIYNDDEEHKNGRIGHWSGLEPRLTAVLDDVSSDDVAVQVTVDTRCLRCVQSHYRNCDNGRPCSNCVKSDRLCTDGGIQYRYRPKDYTAPPKNWIDPDEFAKRCYYCQKYGTQCDKKDPCTRCQQTARLCSYNGKPVRKPLISTTDEFKSRCTGCQHRRRKCDKKLRCSTCVKWQHHCVYDPNFVPNVGPRTKKSRTFKGPPFRCYYCKHKFRAHSVLKCRVEGRQVCGRCRAYYAARGSKARVAAGVPAFRTPAMEAVYRKTHPDDPEAVYSDEEGSSDDDSSLLSDTDDGYESGLDSDDDSDQPDLGADEEDDDHDTDQEMSDQDPPRPRSPEFDPSVIDPRLLQASDPNLDAHGSGIDVSASSSSSQVSSSSEDEFHTPPAALRRSTRTRRVPNRYDPSAYSLGLVSRARVVGNSRISLSPATQRHVHYVTSLRKHQAAEHLAREASGRSVHMITAQLICLAIQVMTPEPYTYRQALADPVEGQLWAKAAADEVDSLLLNNTWQEADLPPGRKALSTRWVFKRKLGPDGSVIRHKGRLVARGFEQIFGLDFDETFASVVKPPSYRLFFAMAALFGWHTRQLDVKTAFLNGEVEEEVYIHPPDGISVTQGKVLRLLRALYGLKQSPRAWYKKLREFLVDNGWRVSPYDSSIFILDGKRGKHHTYLTVYVDDINLFGPDLEMILKTRDILAQKFEMTDLGECNFYLGMHIARDSEKGLLHLHQASYIQQLLDRYGLREIKPVLTPMESKKLHKEVHHTASPKFCKQYQSMVGAIGYLAVVTRPDIAFAFSVLSQFCSNPNDEHMKVLERVFAYLKATTTLGLTYSVGALHTHGLKAYVDSDWAGQDGSRSTTGFVITLAGSPISWGSKRQKTVALSSAEAEYMAATEAGKELLWLSHMIKDLDFPEIGLKNGAELRIDNESAIKIAHNPELHSRTKHIELRHHWIREKVDSGQIRTKWVPGTENTSDGLTKPLPRVGFYKFLEDMNMSKVGCEGDV